MKISVDCPDPSIGEWSSDTAPRHKSL